MSRPVDEAITVNLSSASPNVAVPASVTVAIGSDRADVPVTAATAQMDSVQITASYDGVNVTGDILIYDDAAPRDVVAVSLERDTIPASGMAGGTVSLEIPGAAGGTTVALSVMPANLAMVPPTVTVLEGQLSATFTLTAGADEGNGTLSADAGAAVATFPFAVSNSVERPPAADGDLIITEIHRNPSVASIEHEHEWFEIYNPTADSILLDGLVIADNTDSYTVPASGLTVDPGGYAIIAYNLEPGQNGGVDAPRRVRLRGHAPRERRRHHHHQLPGHHDRRGRLGLCLAGRPGRRDVPEGTLSGGQQHRRRLG